MDRAAITQIKTICPGRVSLDVDLGAMSWWEIGGKVRVMACPASIKEVQQLRYFAAQQNIPTLILGGMSNLLITDRSIDALCIRLGNSFADFDHRPGAATIGFQSGAWVPMVARALQQRGLSGLEHICGIPGTVGGLVMMNGGSMRRGIGSHVVTVKSVDRLGNIVSRNREECDFAYRSSVFSGQDEVIGEVDLKLEPGDSEAMRREMIDILRSRRLKFPRKFPNCGSVFKSNPASYAKFGPPGVLIERMGWKGAERGDAQVSPLHANFIINRGRAKAAEILELIGEIRQSVEEGLGHRMEPEVRFVRSDGRIEDIAQAYRAHLAGAEL
ncbi:UDP-N-acetylmuramate dehydrogenase [Alteripontixanthobacter maritimus]|uniref:UDP-N-acetylenolpyruvoylglucosamine reductase n=1 Tax=Alteripontixanthobacter maritimus TaxID=2161824 RepID=A0A369QDV2_9SPHN|nr:UDP-N-acetylmuramate dehydrogenase [Alteripontixanthobacter maritimus]RDC61396.1 UDP-N-acetylmuramate dehydrogenase [Alteripontixanthobacter maritimus]